MTKEEKIKYQEYRVSWENHGEWYIDHIYPLSRFDVDSPVNVVNSLDNLSKSII